MPTPREFLASAAAATHLDRAGRAAVLAAIRALDLGRLPTGSPYESISIAMEYGVDDYGDKNYGEYGTIYDYRALRMDRSGLTLEGYLLVSDGVAASDARGQFSVKIEGWQVDAAIDKWSTVRQGRVDGPRVSSKPRVLAPPPRRDEEIALQTGGERRSVRLALETNGDIVIDTQDIGPTAKRMFGDSDYEFWLKIPASSASALAHALVRKIHEGNLSAADDLKAFCAANDIPFEFTTWS